MLLLHTELSACTLKGGKVGVISTTWVSSVLCGIDVDANMSNKWHKSKLSVIIYPRWRGAHLIISSTRKIISAASAAEIST